MAQTLMACLHGCLELVLESFRKNPTAAEECFFFHIENGI